MKRSVERRSSKPRIGAASVVGPTPRFRPSGEGWRTIEGAFGCKFDEKDRSEIFRIVDTCLDWQCFEKAAPFLADVDGRIAQLEKAAHALNAAFSGFFGHGGPEAAAAFDAQLAIERVLAQRGFPQRT